MRDKLLRPPSGTNAFGPGIDADNACFRLIAVFPLRLVERQLSAKSRRSSETAIGHPGAIETP